ncbi:hypothetical protein GGI35DRAFT_307863 [Trichoderma velutinum]
MIGFVSGQRLSSSSFVVGYKRLLAPSSFFAVGFSLFVLVSTHASRLILITQTAWSRSAGSRTLEVPASAFYSVFFRFGFFVAFVFAHLFDDILYTILIPATLFIASFGLLLLSIQDNCGKTRPGVGSFLPPKFLVSRDLPLFCSL